MRVKDVFYIQIAEQVEITRSTFKYSIENNHEIIEYDDCKNEEVIGINVQDNKLIILI